MTEPPDRSRRGDAVRPVVTVAEMRAADAAALEPVDESTWSRGPARPWPAPALRMLGGGLRPPGGGGGRQGEQRGRRAGGRRLLAPPGGPGARSSRRPTPRPVLPPVRPGDRRRLRDGVPGHLRGPAVPPAGPGAGRRHPLGGERRHRARPGAGRCGPTLTVTFAALKPGLLQGDGPRLAGRVVVADIGVRRRATRRPHLVGGRRRGPAVPPRAPATPQVGQSRWRGGGLAGHGGGGRLLRPGRLAGPGPGWSVWPSPVGGPAEGPGLGVAVEAVRPGPADGMGRPTSLGVLEPVPGLGDRSRARPATGPPQAEVRRLVARSPVPVVVDADGLWWPWATPTRPRPWWPAPRVDRPVVLTPHDGEYARLAGGSRPGPTAWPPPPGWPP